MAYQTSLTQTHHHQVQRIEDLTRRELIAGALGSALLIACGDDGEDGLPTAEAWSFTDDRGETVSRETTPQRIIAQEDAAAALWSFGIRPVGVFGNAPLHENVQFKDEDLSGIEPVGEVFGEVDVEKMIGLEADLIVTPYWPEQGAAGFGFGDKEQQQRVTAVAPIVAIDVEVPYRKMLGRFRDLASALDADASAATAGQEQLDTAFEALTSAAGRKRDLKVLAVAGSEEGLYVANPPAYSDLMEYAASGLSFVTPEDTSAMEGLWELLSWEQANKYSADVILYDQRAGSFPQINLQDIATWRSLPAVQAGQLGPWFVGTTYRISFFTQQLEQLTALIERAKKIV